MRVLVIGGSGHVGSLVLPFLGERHSLRVFDLKVPADSAGEFYQGSVTDSAALRDACRDQEALLYMAMGAVGPEVPDSPAAAFDVNVKGVHLALNAARQSGISHAVYTSSMSVYEGTLEARGFSDEDLPPDARSTYGFTKRLGEEVCRNACQRWEISVNALRLCWPLAPDTWAARAAEGPTLATRADDVARALLAALEYRNGFQAFFISGDYENRFMNMRKARRLLNWEPLARPEAASPDGESHPPHKNR